MQQMQQQVKAYAVIAVEPERAVIKSAYPASIRGKQDIEIRPMVDGFITQVLVDEGSFVKKGQVMFKIDPVQYQAAVEVAQANVNVARTNVQTAQLTYRNKRDLWDQNIISDYELQTAENDLASQSALLEQAQAQLVSAQKNLSFTNVVSPSDGVVGTIPYRIGSLVGPSMTTPLTTVSDISDMYIYFSMTEKQLLDITRQGGPIQLNIDRMPPVQLQLADGTIYPQTGKVETISGVIDQQTGSVNMRATFPNRNHILRSGGTGVILIPQTIPNALVIPQKATYEIQDREFVYKVTGHAADSALVRSTEIRTQDMNDGKTYLVTQGLQAGDSIVAEGVSSLRDSTRIKPVTPEQYDALVKSMGQQAPAGAAAKGEQEKKPKE